MPKTAKNQRIAVIGTGAMGSRIAVRLIESGFSVTVHNRSRDRARPVLEKGATWASSPGEAARDQDVVLSMVRDDAAAKETWLDGNALDCMQSGTVAVELSTLSPGCTRQLQSHASRLGRRFVEAPVVGTLPQAEAGQLVCLLGGEREAVGAVEPVLECLSSGRHHVGPVGHGAAMKLAVNAMFAVQVATCGEVLALLRAQGVCLQAALDALPALPTTSRAALGAATLMVSREFHPLFPVELVEKDLEYARGLAPAMPLVDAAHGVFSQARERGWGRENLVAVAKLYEPAT